MSGFSMHGEKESASAFALKRARRIAAICIAALMAFGALGLVGCSCSNTSTKTDDDNAKKEQVNDKKNATKTVPNVVGMTKDDAERVIKDAGFAVGTETEEASETVVAGAVISQSVKAKSEAKAGSSTGITVSKGSDKPAKRVSVPSLIGMTQTQAEDVLASLKLVSKAEDPVYSEDAKPGTIFKQSVAAGTEVEEGSTVSFTAALGKDFAIVPRVIGLDRDGAFDALKKASFNVDIIEAYSGNVAAGKVMYQNPSEGVQCVSGTKVTITLSKGAAPAPTEQVAVPNVVTLTLEQAQGVLESAGLACKFAGEEEGMVVEQSIAAGTKVDRGSTVTVKLEILPTGSAEGQAA